jgi:Glyoxalase-like domain
MDTPKPAKNRLHIDINAGGGPKIPLHERKVQVNREVERLQVLGARKDHEIEDKHEFFVVMNDPEGNEFCVQ